VTCRHCGHDVDVHHAQPIGCGTAVSNSLHPYRRVQCPCPRFEEGVPTVMALPPLPPPPDPYEELEIVRDDGSLVRRYIRRAIYGR
jgi:hypothetical protein